MLTARRMSRSRGRRSPYPCPSFTERVFPDVQRFMHHAVEPNVLSFGVDDASSATPVALPPGDPVPSEYLLFVGGLERVQLAAADAFPVPQQWTGVDERELRRALRLLDGQRVRIGGGSAQFVLEAPAPFLRAVGANEKHSLAFDASEPYVAKVCGHELDLGPSTYYVQAAWIEAEPLPGDPGPARRISVIPEPGHGIEVALGSLTQAPGQEPAPPDEAVA